MTKSNPRVHIELNYSATLTRQQPNLMMHIPRKARNSKVTEHNKNSNKITNYANKNDPSTSATQQKRDEVFSVDESDITQVSQSLKQQIAVPPEELKSTLNSFNQNGDIKKMFSAIVNAYSSLAQSTQINYENCSKVAQALDETTVLFRNSSEHLNDEISQLSNRHLDYIEKNENDKQEMKIKADVRYYKTQMIIYLQNDDKLRSITNNNAMHEANKIISECGLSLGKAYITKSIILSGMKKISGVNKFIKYLYVHFSDAFTSERLIMELIQKNKKSANPKQPEYIFAQPTSYDINKVKNVCNELRFDGSVSKVFLGDDAIKVTLNKKDPNDANEVPRKVYVRNFADVDKLRKDVVAKNNEIPTKIFYNKDYWTRKYPSAGRKSNDKRKAVDDPQYDSPTSSIKKQRRGHNSHTSQGDEESNDSYDTSRNTVQENDS